MVDAGSIWQVGEQQSLASVFPSSQVSPASMMPSPQIAIARDADPSTSSDASTASTSFAGRNAPFSDSSRVISDPPPVVSDVAG
jgi:hypothetical protein